MFDIKKNGNKKMELSVSSRGYEYSDSEMVLQQIIVNMQSRVPALVVLCGNVTDNYHGLLQSWANRLAEKKYITHPAVKKMELLPLLSSASKIQDVSKKLVRAIKTCDQIYFINGLHQVDYDITSAVCLLEALCSLYGEDDHLAPVVLNIPVFAWQELQRDLPDLKAKSICLVNGRGAGANAGYGAKPKTQTSYMKTSLNHEDRNSIHPKQMGADENLMRPKQMEEDVTQYLPWYKSNNGLFKRETEGMAHFLQKGGSKFKMAAMPESKRLYFAFDISYNRNVNLKIVYLSSFSEENTDVGIVIENNDRSFHEYMKKGSKKVIDTDVEFGRIYMVWPDYTKGAPSAGVAVLYGLLNILDGLDKKW